MFLFYVWQILWFIFLNIKISTSNFNIFLHFQSYIKYDCSKYLLGIDTAICRCLQSLMRYAINAKSICPGAQNIWTKFPESKNRNCSDFLKSYRGFFLPTSDLCLTLVISTAIIHMVTKVPMVPNPQNTLVTRNVVQLGEKAETLF